MCIIVWFCIHDLYHLSTVLPGSIFPLALGVVDLSCPSSFVCCSLRSICESPLKAELLLAAIIKLYYLFIYIHLLIHCILALLPTMRCARVKQGVSPFQWSLLSFFLSTVHCRPCPILSSPVSTLIRDSLFLSSHWYSSHREHVFAALHLHLHYQQQQQQQQQHYSPSTDLSSASLGLIIIVDLFIILSSTLHFLSLSPILTLITQWD